MLKTCRYCNNKPCGVYTILTRLYITDGSISRDDFSTLIIDISLKCTGYIEIDIKD